MPALSPVRIALLGALTLAAAGTASAGEWRLDPSRCPDLREDRIDQRVDYGRADRREDIRDLTDHFMRHAADATGQQPRRLGEDALAALQSYAWPGNVRELRNVIERVLILAPGDNDTVLGASMLPTEFLDGIKRSAIGSDEGYLAKPLRDAREDFEREYLNAQMSRFNGNISRTAQFVGMERSALHRKLKSLGLTDEDRGAS